MSDDLYPTRLWWGQGRGVARHDGVYVVLRAAPALTSVPTMTEIDYAPNIVALVREGCGPSRDLTHDEMHDALAMLQDMARRARSALEWS